MVVEEQDEQAGDRGSRQDRAPRAIHLFGRRIGLPRHPAPRIGLGAGLVTGGLLGFLPILGFWMIPLGIAVLAVDIPAARRLWLALRRAGIRLFRLVRGRPAGRR